VTPCENFQIALLETLAGGSAAPAEAAAHLQACQACRSWERETREAIQELEAWRLSDPGEIFFARQSRQILTQLQGESAFELEGEDLALKGLLLEIPEAEPKAEFFPRQSQSIMEQIRSEVRQPQSLLSLWKKSLLAAAALGLLCWGAARLVPFQALQTGHNLQATITPPLSEDASDLNLEALDSQQLDRLASQLENRFLSDNAGDLEDDEGDWEDLSDSEIELLIERWQGMGRST